MKLRCWIREGIESVLLSPVLGGVFAAIGLISKGFAHAIAALPYYTLVGGIILSLILTTAVYLTDVPMHLALGSTRRNVKFGIQTVTVILAAGTILLTLVLCLVLPSDPAGQLLPLLPAAFPLMLSICKLGSISGCVSAIHPKAGRVFASTIVFFVCGATGGLVGAMAADGTLPDLQQMQTWGSTTGFWAVLLAVLAALTVIELLLQQRLLKTYEVRF